MSQSALNQNQPNRKKELLSIPTSSRFLPVFWTIASVLSFVINVILIAVVIVILQQLSVFRVSAGNQTSGLFAELYGNFEKMDNAAIRTNIPVDANIPLNIIVPVKGTTRIVLAEDTVIQNAHVLINTDSMNIDSDATVTLPANTPLTVILDFPLPVENTIPIHLDVPVNVPLNQTELHEPLQGFLSTFKPYYCLVSPKAKSIFDNSSICSSQAP